MNNLTPPHSHLTLKFNLVAILPVLIISGLLVFILFPHINRQTVQHHESLASSVANQISAYLMGGERQLLALASYLDSKRQWTTTCPVNQMLDSQCGIGELFETIYITSPSDKHIQYVGLAEKAGETTRLKRDDLLGLDLIGRDFIAAGGQRKLQPSWSETFLSTVSSRLAVALTIPISMHTITGEVTLYRLSELISNLPTGNDIFTLVLDRNHRIIADSQQIRWGQQLNFLGNRQPPENVPPPSSPVLFELDGLRMQGTFVNIRHLGWTVVVAQPVESANQTKHATFFVISAAFGFALFLAFMVASLQGAKLTRAFNQYVREKQENQDDLLKAKQDAEAASIAKSEFLAHMSHDLRTPLNGIMGMLQLLDQTSVNNEQQEYIRIARKSSKRLTGLLSDILDLSRVEAGEMPICNEPYDLTKAIGNIYDLFNTTFRQKGVELTYSIHPSIPRMVIGDSARLQQVLSNLLGNAVKFTKQGRVSVELYPLPKSQPDEQRILVTVTDTGPGIAAADLDHIFEPFRQAGNDRTLYAQGSGLGLAICKQLVQLMGGDISVESEPGYGTTFTFCIASGHYTGRSEVQVTASTPTGQDFRNLEILVAEDEPINATTIKLLLEKAGCTVTVVDNGEKALDVLSRHHYHGVFLDIQMPVKDGLETLKAIRRGKAGDDKKDIPVFALTAFAMKGDEASFLAEGMDGYISKPLEVAALESALQQLAGRGELERRGC